MSTKLLTGAIALLAVGAVASPALATNAHAPETKTSDRHDEADARGGRFVSRAVSFAVKNVNNSKLPCPTDGRDYTIRGHIVGPRNGMSHAKSVALYLHGLELGEFFWTYPAQGESFVERQARDGHLSVVIDRLGYDKSGKPGGMQSCLGGQADTAHQIVDQLRSGDYGVVGHDGAPKFEKVVLGGHSVGGCLPN